MKEKIRLNANALKVIAIIAMTIDHFTDIFYPGFQISPEPLALHFIGRLTAPIMWFFVCEGYYYTRDARKYLQRLGIFAVISHFAYCFGFGISLNPFEGGIFNRTSVMYPLFIAVLILYISDHGLPVAKWMKWFFYLYYPAHLILLGILRVMIYGDINLTVQVRSVWISGCVWKTGGGIIPSSYSCIPQACNLLRS